MYVGDVEIGALFLSTQFKGHRWNCKYMLPECEWLVKCTDGKDFKSRDFKLFHQSKSLTIDMYLFLDLDWHWTRKIYHIAQHTYQMTSNKVMYSQKSLLETRLVLINLWRWLNIGKYFHSGLVLKKCAKSPYQDMFFLPIDLTFLVIKLRIYDIRHSSM